MSIPTMYINNTLSDALIIAAQNLFGDEKTELQPAHYWKSAKQSLHSKLSGQSHKEVERRNLSAWILAKPFRVSIHFYITGDDLID